MLQDKNILFARFVSSKIHDDWRVFYAQMTSCALHYDVIYHPSPINSHYLNTWGVDSPAFGKKRIKSYTNSPLSSCQANQPTNLYQSKAWCTTIHLNMSFINLCSEWNVFSFFFFSYERTSTRSCFDKAPEGKWKSEKDYCRSWTAPGLGGILYWVGVKLQFWRQGTGHVTSWRSRLAGNAKKLRS